MELITSKVREEIKKDIMNEVKRFLDAEDIVNVKELLEAWGAIDELLLKRGF